ncbi:MAG: hypothetical protein WAX07_08140 [Candidatus Altiarchaeia archaeon]
MGVWEGLFDPRYREILERFPLYTRDDEAMLAKKTSSNFYIHPFVYFE